VGDAFNTQGVFNNLIKDLYIEARNNRFKDFIKKKITLTYYPPHGLFTYAHSPTQLNGTPSSMECVCKIEPHLFPYTI
jgi:hypothetical protein